MKIFHFRNILSCKSKFWFQKRHLVTGDQASVAGLSPWGSISNKMKLQGPWNKSTTRSPTSTFKIHYIPRGHCIVNTSPWRYKNYDKNSNSKLIKIKIKSGAWNIEFWESIRKIPYKIKLWNHKVFQTVFKTNSLLVYFCVILQDCIIVILLYCNIVIL